MPPDKLATTAAVAADVSVGHTAALLLAIGALVALNGFFVAAEFAIVRVRSTQLDSLARGGMRRAAVARKVVSQLDAYLSATQLGITIASILLGWVGKDTLSHHVVEPVFAALGIANELAISVTSFLFGTCVIVFLHVVLGELAPKSLAIRHPEKTALWVAYPLRWFHWVMYPAISALNNSANWFLKLAGTEPASESDLAHSEEELRMLVAASQTMGVIGAEKRVLLENVFEMSDTIVRQIMVPRTQMAAFDLRKPLGANLAVAESTAHSRYPLIDGDLDHVVGVVHMKDLFWQLTEMQMSASGEPGQWQPAAGEDSRNPMIAGGDLGHNPPATGADFLRKIAREVPFIPETMRIDMLLRDFQRRHVHLAVVVDEFGGTSGMVTFENVIEEIVGQVQDEFDHEENPVRKTGEGEYVLLGVASLVEVNEALGTSLEAPDADTIGGFFLHEFGRLPEAGDRLVAGGLELTVRDMAGVRINSIAARMVDGDGQTENHDAEAGG